MDGSTREGNTDSTQPVDLNEETESDPIITLINENWLLYAVHMLASAYHWSYNQCDEVYPEQASYFLKIIGMEKQDNSIREKIEYYTEKLDILMITHGDDLNKVQNKFIQNIENIQKILINKSERDGTDHTVTDDDLPDLVRLKELKDFKKSH